MQRLADFARRIMDLSKRCRMLKSKVLEAEFLTLAALFLVLLCNSIPLINKDGTRRVSCVDPCSAATRSLATSVEQENKILSKIDLQRIFGDTEDDSGDMDNIYDSAENTLVSAENQSEDAETFRDAEKLKSPTSARNSTMAHINNRNLHLLADAALGTYVEEEHQSARSTPEEDLLREGQQPIHATPRDDPPHDDEQPVQASPYQGFTAINSARATGRLAPNNPHPPPHGFTAINTTAATARLAQNNPHPPPHGFTAINTTAATARLAQNNPRPPPHGMTASTRPSQRVTKRKSAPRTTGFNQETGSGLLTAVCARVTPSKGQPVPHRSGAGGAFRCPRCHGRFTKPRSVKDHFIKCVNNYGNPAGLNWFDHPSLAKSKNWHLQHMPKQEEDEDEENEENEEDEEDEDVEMQEGGDDDE